MTSLMLLGAAAVVGFCGYAWLARLGAGRAGALAALLVMGQAAALQLIDAGPRVAYQHLKPLGRMWAESPLSLAIVLVQSVLVLVLALLWRHGREPASPLGRSVRGWRLAACIAVVVLGSATLSRQPAAYFTELAAATLLELIALANLYLAVRALPPATRARLCGRLDALLGRSDDPATPARVDRFTLVLAAWVVVAALLLNLAAYQRFPHLPDEVAYLFHAKYFAAGRLYLPPPPVQAAFDVDLLTYEPGRWYSPVPPGWPAMLAVGARLGWPELVNPLLGGLNVVLASLLLQRLYDRRTARVALVLLAASPWNLFLAMSYMNHTFTFTCALVAALGVARSREGGPLSWPFTGGLAAGVTSLIRPLEGAIVAGLLGLWALAPRAKRWGILPAAGFALGTVLTGALVFRYNAALTGKLLTFPLMVYTDTHYGPGTNALGFGPNRGLGWGGLDPLPGHGPLDVLVNADLNGTGVNTELLGWATGSLLPLAALLFLLPHRRADRLMLAAIAAVVGVHSFYWFSGGPDFGARYWYLILLPCLALAASCLTTLDRDAGGAGRASLAAVGLALSALATFVPWRAADKYYHYRGMRPDLRTLARRGHFGPSLVLVRGQRHPDYHSAALLNPLDLGARETIYAWDRDSATREAVLKAYPDRRIWLVDGPSVTHQGFRVVAGPLPNPAARP